MTARQRNSLMTLDAKHLGVWYAANAYGADRMDAAVVSPGYRLV